MGCQKVLQGFNIVNIENIDFYSNNCEIKMNQASCLVQIDSHTWPLQYLRKLIVSLYDYQFNNKGNCTKCIFSVLGLLRKMVRKSMPKITVIELSESS